MEENSLNVIYNMNWVGKKEGDLSEEVLIHGEENVEVIFRIGFSQVHISIYSVYTYINTNLKYIFLKTGTAKIQQNRRNMNTAILTIITLPFHHL